MTRTKTAIQYFSDLHLEFGDLTHVQGDADVIVAAGDISIGLDGIRWLREFDRPVVYVLGNHEFWGQNYRDFIDRMRRECSGSNIHFLENDSTIINGVRFVGCSLWTNYGGENKRAMSTAVNGMNDFRYIADGVGKLQIRHVLNAHYQSVDWLQHVFDEPFDGQTVVVTHHAPSFKSWHRGESDHYRYCYCSDLEAIIKNSNATLWVHGHTHELRDYYISDVRVVCNPRGYVKVREVQGFQLDRVIEI